MTYTEIEKYVIDNRKYYPKKLEQKDIVNFIYNFCTEQCQKRDELIKAQDELLEVRKQTCEILADNKNTEVFRMIGLVKLDNELKAKIEQLKKELK